MVVSASGAAFGRPLKRHDTVAITKTKMKSSRKDHEELQ
jgi:hypothetical protein